MLFAECEVIFDVLPGCYAVFPVRSPALVLAASRRRHASTIQMHPLLEATSSSSTTARSGSASDERQRELLFTKGCMVPQRLLGFKSEAADGPSQQYVLEAEMKGGLHVPPA